MKYLLILLILIPNLVEAQKDSVTPFFYIDTSLFTIKTYQLFSGNIDSPYVAMYIDEDNDTTITVVGDSLTAIKSLLIIWCNKEKELKKLEDIFDIFINKVMEYLLNNNEIREL